MEISYEKPCTLTQKVEISDEDLGKLKELAKAAFADRVRVIGLANPSLQYEEEAKQICEKYGVDTSSKLGTAQFLLAALGVPSESIAPTPFI